MTNELALVGAMELVAIEDFATWTGEGLCFFSPFSLSVPTRALC